MFDTQMAKVEDHLLASYIFIISFLFIGSSQHTSERQTRQTKRISRKELLFSSKNRKDKISRHKFFFQTNSNKSKSRAQPKTHIIKIMEKITLLNRIRGHSLSRTDAPKYYHFFFLVRYSTPTWSFLVIRIVAGSHLRPLLMPFS